MSQQQQLTAEDPFSTIGYHDRRRSEPRTLCDREITVISCVAAAAACGNGRDGSPVGRPIKARLTDCSLHGLGMMMPEEVEAGTQVLAKVEMNRLPMMLMYTVRYCVPMQSDQFRTGLRFTGFVASRFRGEMRTVLGALAGA